MEHLEILVPILALLVGTTSSLLISVAKIVIKKYSCKELEDATARWITLVVCLGTTLITMTLVEFSIPAFATLFLAVFGSSQVAYYTNLPKFVESE